MKFLLAWVVVFVAIGQPGYERVLSQLDDLQRTNGVERLRIVWKLLSKDDPLPDHMQTQVALGVASVGGQDAIRKFHELVRLRPDDARQLGPLLTLAHEAGVGDPVAFDRRVTAGEFKPLMQSEDQTAEQLRVTAPGVVFINGYRLSGRIKKTILAAVVADEMRRTQALLNKDMTPADAYAQRTRDNASQGQDFPDQRPPLDGSRRYRVSLETSPSRGDRKAPVVLVCFAGYQEPEARQLAPLLRAVLKRYPHDVRIVWKFNPVPGKYRLADPLALSALQARLDGGDEAFWRVTDRLLDDATWKPVAAQLDQPDQGEALAKIRASVGLKKDPVFAYGVQHSLASDKAQSRALNANHHPLLFVNGRPLVADAPTEAALRSLVDEELTAARQKVSAGVAPEQVYDTLMAALPDPASDE